MAKKGNDWPGNAIDKLRRAQIRHGIEVNCVDQTGQGMAMS